MKSLILSLFVGLNCSIFAVLPNKKDKLIKHLVEINKEWKNHASEIKDKFISFENDEQRIQSHLFLLVSMLKKEHLKLNSPQLINRLFLIQELENYAQRKVFPINLNHKDRTPYFIDHLGTHCAVAYLMKQSGFGNLARKISENENYAYLRDIKTAGVSEWANKFGMTLDELALIQPGYQVMPNWETMGGNTNGPINDLEFFYGNSVGSLVFTGNFTELKNSPCLNIGYYADDQLSCLGEGIEGKINELSTNYGLYVVGSFPFENENYQMANFVNNEWVRYKVPNSGSAEGVVINKRHVFNGNKFADLVIYYADENKSEVWSIDALFNYTKRASVNGIIMDVAEDNTSTLVGHFDSCFVYTNSQITDTLICNNIISYSEAYLFNNNISGPVSDTIKTVEQFFGAYYFGGNCNNYETNQTCVSRYLGGVMQPIVSGYALFNYYTHDSIFSVEKIRIAQEDERLYFSGDISTGFMYNGSGFLSYNAVNTYLEAENHFFGPVNDFMNINGRYYYVGEGIYNNEVYGFIVRDKAATSVDELNGIPASVFPNPSNGMINIKGLQFETSYQVFDLMGKLVASGNVENECIDFSNLVSGTFLLKLTSNEQEKTIKLMIK